MANQLVNRQTNLQCSRRRSQAVSLLGSRRTNPQAVLRCNQPLSQVLDQVPCPANNQRYSLLGNHHHCHLRYHRSSLVVNRVASPLPSRLYIQLDSLLLGPLVSQAEDPQCSHLVNHRCNLQVNLVVSQLCSLLFNLQCNRPVNLQLSLVQNRVRDPQFNHPCNRHDNRLRSPLLSPAASRQCNPPHNPPAGHQGNRPVNPALDPLISLLYGLLDNRPVSLVLSHRANLLCSLHLSRLGNRHDNRRLFPQHSLLMCLHFNLVDSLLEDHRLSRVVVLRRSPASYLRLILRTSPALYPVLNLLLGRLSDPHLSPRLNLPVDPVCSRLQCPVHNQAIDLPWFPRHSPLLFPRCCRHQYPLLCRQLNRL